MKMYDNLDALCMRSSRYLHIELYRSPGCICCRVRMSANQGNKYYRVRSGLLEFVPNYPTRRSFCRRCSGRLCRSTMIPDSQHSTKHPVSVWWLRQRPVCRQFGIGDNLRRSTTLRSDDHNGAQIELAASAHLKSILGLDASDKDYGMKNCHDQRKCLFSLHPSYHQIFILFSFSGKALETAIRADIGRAS